MFKEQRHIVSGVNQLFEGFDRIVDENYNYFDKAMLWTLIFVNTVQVHFYFFEGVGVLHWLLFLGSAFILRTEVLPGGGQHVHFMQ